MRRRAVWAMRWSAVAITVAVLGCPRAAHADDAENLSRATQLYDEALPFLTKKDYATACPKLEEAVRLVSVAVGARLALSDCYEGQGKLASALSMAETSLSLASAGNQAERVELAKQRIQSLTPRVGRVNITLAPGAAEVKELKISFDGKDVARDAWGKPRRLDKGKYAVAASAPNRKKLETSVVVEDGKEASVVIPVLEDLQAPGPATQPAVPGTPETPEAEGGGVSPLLITGIIAGGLGLVGIGVGAAFGSIASSNNDDSIAAGCAAGLCPTQEGLDARNAAFDAATISTALFITGGVLAGAGLTLTIIGATAGGDEAPAQAGRLPRFTVGVGPGNVSTKLVW